MESKMKGDSRDLERAVGGPKPVRIQLSRAKGWRMPPNTVKVDRSTWAGNPWRVEKRYDWWTVRSHNGGVEGGTFRSEEDAVSYALTRFRELVVANPEPLAELRGKNLACWCKLCPDHRAGKPFGFHCEACAPCHADVLLELANAVTTQDPSEPRDESQ